jgi:hypothetical protein
MRRVKVRVEKSRIARNETSTKLSRAIFEFNRDIVATRGPAQERSTTQNKTHILDFWMTMIFNSGIIGRARMTMQQILRRC